MSVAGVNDATKRWKEWCDNVQAQTTVNRAESEADKQARIKRARADYAFFVNYYFPHYTDDPATGKHTESALLHIEAANKNTQEPQPQSCVQMGARTRQEYPHG